MPLFLPFDELLPPLFPPKHSHAAHSDQIMYKEIYIYVIQYTSDEMPGMKGHVKVFVVIYIYIYVYIHVYVCLPWQQQASRSE